MVDDAQRPSWGAPAPAPDAHPPAAPAPPAPPTPPDPPRPAWEAPAAGPHRIDLRLVIPVLIGLVSVTGAVVAWQSSLAGEKATDKDRQAVAEAVQVSQAAADVEIVVQDAIVRFSEHAAALINADLLEADAGRFSGAGNVPAAEAATDEAVEERAVARRVLEGGSVPLDLYVDTTGDTPFFDSAQLRTDLLEAVARELQVDPEQTQSEANTLRNESQHFDGWLIALVGAVVLLTLAQISRARAVKLGFLGMGAVVWIVASVLAFSG